MKRLKDIYGLLKEIGTFIIGGLVFILTAIVGLIYSLVKHLFIKFDYSLSRQLTPFIRMCTLALDGLANAFAGEMINDFYNVKGKVKYGKWSETISAITGLRCFNGNDTNLRKVLDKVLGEKHCQNGITKQQAVYNNIEIMELDINFDYEDNYDDLIDILAAQQDAYVDLRCISGDEVWVENVSALADGSFAGTLYNNSCGGSITDTVYFVKENIYSAECCSRPTGR